MSWLSDFFHGGKDPSKAAQKYLDQIPGQAHQGYDQYANQGHQADTDLWARFSEMLNNPNKLYDTFASGYKPSEAYQQRSKELTTAVNNAAGAGGIGGTPAHQAEIGKGIEGLLSKDQGDYIDKIAGIFGQGLSGEQGVSNRGYDATKSLTDILTQALSEQGGLAYKGQESRNAAQQALVKSLMQFLQQGAGAAAQGMSGGAGGAGAGGAAGGASFFA